MKLKIIKYREDLPIDDIYISKDNVRKSGATEGLDDLKENIKKFGLIQPVTVFKKDNLYELLVGQRRFLACKALGHKTIRAFLITSMDETSRTIISYGENVHRKDLPYEDSIQVCNKLFKRYKGTKKSKIQQISKDLGISIGDVSKYLQSELVPKEVQKLVDDGKITETFAYNVTNAHFPNTEKIVDITKQALKMTSGESNRAVEYSKNYPKAKMPEILNYAKSPPPLVKLVIHIEPSTMNRLKSISKKRQVTIEKFVKNAIRKSLSNEG